MSEVTVAVTIPAAPGDAETQGEKVVTLTLSERTVELRVGYQTARVEFDHLADAFEVLRSVHSAELRTIMGHPARDLVGPSAGPDR